MADPKKIYWDACIWISLIRGDKGRAEICEKLIEQAKINEIQIWTSSLTLAEVFKKKCGPVNVAIDPENDSNFESYIEQEFLVEVQLDHDVGVMARTLLRHHSELKKPADAIHLASAVLNNLDELHTFDGDNLLILNGKIKRSDGKPLHILTPELPKGSQIELLERVPTQAGTSAAPNEVSNDVDTKQTTNAEASGQSSAVGAGSAAPDVDDPTAATQTTKG